MIRTAATAAAILIALAACSKPAEPVKESDVVPLPAPDATAPGAPSAARAAAQPAGPAEPAAQLTDQLFISAASVTDVAWLPDQNAKIFSAAGGDPAINGLLTQIAFPPESPDEDWAVYRVGDFETWSVAEKGPGRVVLDVRVSRIDQSTGNPVTESKRLIVNWTGEGTARAVTVTPGR